MRRAVLIWAITIITAVSLVLLMRPSGKPPPAARPTVNVALTVVDDGCILAPGTLVTFSTSRNHLAGIAYLTQTGPRTYQAWAAIPSYTRYNVAIHGAVTRTGWFTRAALTSTPEPRLGCAADPY